MIFLFDHLIQFLALLVFPLIIFALLTKFKVHFSTSLKKRNRKIDSSDANNLTLEKSLIIILQLSIIILNSTTLVQESFTPILILILHTIICFSFFIKSNEKTKFWNNIYNVKFITLITIICSQLLFLAWQISNTIFGSDYSLFWFFFFNSIFFFMTFKVFNQALLITKYLTFKTLTILIAKKNSNLYFNHQHIFNFYSKTEAISNLWNFENLKHEKETTLNNIQDENSSTIKNNFIIFIIALINLFSSNIIKTQKIIINGWKISLNQ